MKNTIVAWLQLQEANISGHEHYHAVPHNMYHLINGTVDSLITHTPHNAYSLITHNFGGYQTHISHQNGSLITHNPS